MATGEEKDSLHRDMAGMLCSGRVIVIGEVTGNMYKYLSSWYDYKWYDRVGSGYLPLIGLDINYQPVLPLIYHEGNFECCSSGS